MSYGERIPDGSQSSRRSQLFFKFKFLFNLQDSFWRQTQILFLLLNCRLGPKGVPLPHLSRVWDARSVFAVWNRESMRNFVGLRIKKWSSCETLEPQGWKFGILTAKFPPRGGRKVWNATLCKCYISRYAPRGEKWVVSLDWCITGVLLSEIQDQNLARWYSQKILLVYSWSIPFEHVCWKCSWCGLEGLNGL